jgi:hypothetical protein
MSSKDFQRFLNGGCAAGLAELATLPIDLIKVRLQLVGANHPGLGKVVGQTFKNEGLAAFWKGGSPAVARQIGYTGTCMLLYAPLRDIFGMPDSTHFLPKFLAGGTAGAIGIAIMNPVEVVKVRIQASATRVYPSIVAGLSTIVKTEGVSGLYKGLFPNVQRAFLLNAAELGTYDQAKQYLVNWGIVSPSNVSGHFAASIVAGFFSALASNPVDVLKTRLMNQRERTGNGFVDFWNCARGIVVNEGVASFYSGFIPNWMRKGPWCIVFFLFYERFQQLSDKYV